MALPRSLAASTSLASRPAACSGATLTRTPSLMSTVHACSWASSAAWLAGGNTPSPLQRSSGSRGDEFVQLLASKALLLHLAQAGGELFQLADALCRHGAGGLVGRVAAAGVEDGPALALEQPLHVLRADARQDVGIGAVVVDQALEGRLAPP